jgi:UDP-glucuronate 4-epimerase
VYGGLKEFPFQEDLPADRPISPYAATKRMNELMAHVYSQVYGLNITLLRFFTVYGPRQRPDMAIHKFAEAIREGKPVTMFGDGSSRRDYTYVQDIVDGVLRAVDSPFRYEIFNLGEQQTIQLRDLIDLMARAIGKEAVIDIKPFQAGDVEITCADIRKAKEKLGYQPQFSVEQGIANYVEWLNNRDD